MSGTIQVVMNWSSGKDASLAYHLISGMEGYKVSHLLTTLSAQHDRIFMHGVREKLLDIQAERMGKPLIKVKLPASPDDNIYKAAMAENLSVLKHQGVTTAAFGDIFLEDLKIYREQQLQKTGMTALFPLWKKDTKALIKMVEETGIEAIIVCVNEKHLGKEFLGKKISTKLIDSFPPDTDPCGENGEYHTFVYNAPFFSAPIPVKTGEIIHTAHPPEGNEKWDTSFYFLDVDVI